MKLQPLAKRFLMVWEEVAAGYVCRAQAARVNCFVQEGTSSLHPLDLRFRVKRKSKMKSTPEVCGVLQPVSVSFRWSKMLSSLLRSNQKIPKNNFVNKQIPWEGFVLTVFQVCFMAEERISRHTRTFTQKDADRVSFSVLSLRTCWQTLVRSPFLHEARFTLKMSRIPLHAQVKNGIVSTKPGCWLAAQDVSGVQPTWEYFSLSPELGITCALRNCPAPYWKPHLRGLPYPILVIKPFSLCHPHVHLKWPLACLVRRAF